MTNDTGAVKPAKADKHYLLSSLLDAKVLLREKKIGSGVYYPRPLHLQPCFANLGYHERDFAVAEEISHKVLSLPIYPGLKKREIETVAATVLEFLQNNAPIGSRR